jgi:hypothetical protein
VFRRQTRAMPVLTALVAALVVTTAPVAQAAKLRSQNLAQLIADSQSIIAGRVTRVTDGIAESGMPYTEVTIQVEDAAKGSVAKDTSYTFRQFGLLKPRKMPNGHMLVATTPDGFPNWAVGERVVAFMYQPASRTGLQTTAGMAQGKLTMASGRLSNEFDNVGLFADMEVDESLLTKDERAMLDSQQGAVDASTFMGLVGRAVADGWVESGRMR